jgi:hypothetical protein
MENPNNLQRVCFRILYDEVISVWQGGPKAQSASRQIRPEVARQWRLRQLRTSHVNRLFNAIRRVLAISGDVAPDFKEIVNRLGSELVAGHV